MNIECNNYKTLYARGTDEYSACREAERAATARPGTSPISQVNGRVDGLENNLVGLDARVDEAAATAAGAADAARAAQHLAELNGDMIKAIDPNAVDAADTGWTSYLSSTPVALLTGGVLFVGGYVQWMATRHQRGMRGMQRGFHRELGALNGQMAEQAARMGHQIGALGARVDRHERAINGIMNVAGAMAAHGRMHIGNFVGQLAEFGVAAPGAVAAVIDGLIRDGVINHNDEVRNVADHVNGALQNHPW